MSDDRRTGRGDGIGIELTSSVVRGVVLDRSVDGRVKAAAEVGISSMRDDRAVLDALVRLRAELGGGSLPTRVALFPPGSTLHRLDVTGRSGPELNGMRSALEHDHDVLSTVLIDDGPRRWLMAVRWDEAWVRRIEELVERAGFVDVAVDPSPVAVSRVMPPGTTGLRRDAAIDESFDVILRGIPIVAYAIESVGRQPPALRVSTTAVSATMFDDVVDPAEIVARTQNFIDGQVREVQELAAAGATDLATIELRVADSSYPPYPAHDIRAPERQCVALGAAVGAAGLSGRIRPIDMMLPAATVAHDIERPWAIERISTLAPKATPRPVTPAKRFVGRILLRRRSR